VNVLLQTLAPIALIVAVGAFAQRFLSFDVRALSRLTLYILSPALVLSTMASRDTSGGSAARIALAFVGATLLLYLLAIVIGRAARLPDVRRKTLVATTLFGNTGNMGLPLVFFALGDAGFEQAVVVFVASGILVFGFGPALVQGQGLASGVRTVLRLPLIWALTAGVVLGVSGVELPWRLDEGVDMLGRATIPVLLLVLGMQIARSQLRPTPFVLGASALRLVASPLAAYAIGRLVGLDTLGLQVLVLQFATPTAVNAMLVATEFGGDGKRTAQVVVTSTLLSLATVPLVLWWIG
jgi:malate permease and related proteins